MRRQLLICAAAMGAAGLFMAASPAGAEPAPGRQLCAIDDEKLPAITGLVAVQGGGFVAVNEKSAAGALRLYSVDGSCKVQQRILNDAGNPPSSIQDLARTPDGTLWVADIGDVNSRRETIAVFKVPPGATKATRHRLRYPDGKHHAAALVVQPNGVPVVLTRQSGGQAKIYTTGVPLTEATTNLKAAGTFNVPKSSTPGGSLGKLSQESVSGAALSPDGKKVVVRTQTDAYEWDIQADDIAATIGSGKPPRATPLPNEGSGEAITYTADGAGFVTASMSQPSPLFEWSPAPLPAPSVAPKQDAPAGAAGDDGFSFSSLTFGQVGGLILGVGAVGLMMLIAGIVGIVRFRRQQAAEPGEPSVDERIAEARGRSHGAHTGYPPAEATVAVPHAGAADAAAMTSVLAAEPPRGTVYGGGAASAESGARPRGTVYGAPPAAAPVRGTVYGGTTYTSGAAGAASVPPPPGAGAPPRTGGTPPRSAGASPPGASAPPPGQPRGTTYGGSAAVRSSGHGRSAGPGAAGGQSAARPVGQVYGRPPSPPVGSDAENGQLRGLPPSGGTQHSRGAVYGGGRPAGELDAPAADPHDTPQRAPRDWRSRRPPD